MGLCDLWNKFLDSMRASKPKDTRLTLSSMSSGSMGTNVAVIGKLVRVNGMAAIPNAAVVVTVTPPSGTPWTANKTTDANGQFTVSVPLAVQGSYVIKADYAGEANKYKPSSATVTITSLPAPVTTTLTLSGPSSGTVGDNLTITATLTA